jgi:hypothetical protein
MAAAQALLAGDFPAANRLLSDLGDAAADDFGLRLTRDAIWIQDPSLARRGAAARDLEQLSSLPEQRLAALRIRLAAALRERDRIAARDVGEALAAEPGGSFADLLDAAAAERLGRGATGADPALLDRIRARAAADGLLAVKYARWVGAEQGGSAAQAWLDGLPSTVREVAAVKAERARLAADRGDWTALRGLLRQEAWGPMPSAAIDLAFAAFAARRRGDENLAGRAWAEALDAESGNAEGLDGLAHLASAWRWPEAVRSAFTVALRLFPDQPGLYRRYAAYLRAQGDSRGLLMLAGAGMPEAGDDARRANWALLSFLVDPAAAPPAALATLESLATRQPGNPYYLTDYAFALWRMGRFREAASVADRLSDADRGMPDRAPFLAAIYAGAGQTGAARAALARAPRSSQLLPEEAKLVADAYAKVAR